MPAVIISIDDFKERIEGYSPEHAGEFHVRSAKMADQEFDKIVKDSTFGRVIFLAGGSASGKTEYLHTYLLGENAIIFDSTFSTTEGAGIKIEKARKYCKETELHFIIPDDIKRAFTAFLGRERKFDDKVFYTTHSHSRSTLLWIINNYPEVDIKLIESYYKINELRYKEIQLQNRKSMLEYIKSIQYDIDEIVKKVV